MSDISIRTEASYLNEDQRWLYGGTPDGKNIDILLDRSNFDLVSAFPNGFIPSGIALAKVTATGLYIPYVNETTEAQVLTRTSTGGTITLNIDGEVTAAIAASAAGFTAAAVQTAVDVLDNVDDEHTITVSGSAGGPLTLAYGGLWAGENMPQVIVDNTSATGGTIVASTSVAGGVTTPAGEGVGKGLLFATVAYDRNSAATADIAAALCTDATILESLLPSGHGVDAAFKADCPHLKFLP